jgi:hypothetical protein
MQLTVDNLSKNYRGGVQALRNVHLSLKPGVLGLLGPNGAGKSTLMRILATITQPSAGRVLWNDDDIARNPDALRGVLGYLPQDFGVYPNLSAIEFLDYLAAVKGIPAAAARKRISELLALVNLADAAKRPLQPLASIPKNVSASEIYFPSFPASASSSSPRTSCRTSKPSPPKLPSWRKASFWLTVRRKLFCRESQGKFGKWSSLAPSFPLFAQSTSSAAPLIAAMACMPASSPTARHPQQRANSTPLSKTPTSPSSPRNATPRL